MHSFPKDAVRRAQWMKNVNRLDPSSNPRAPKLLEPSHSAKICEVSSEEDVGRSSFINNNNK